MKSDSEVLKDFRRFLINLFLHKKEVYSTIYQFHCGDVTLYCNIGYRKYWNNFLDNHFKLDKKENDGINPKCYYVFIKEEYNDLKITSEKEIDDLYFKLTGRILKDEK